MVDSAVIGWGLGSGFGHVARYRGLPWNVPLQRRVESSWLWRTLAYAMKCVPIPRGGDRQEVAHVLERLAHLLRGGDAVLMFPEGGRSRSGRVDTEATAADGVGRLISDVEGCRVLCVYARGDAQRTWSNFPARGETFTIALRLVEPRTELRGLRASRDLATQVVQQLVDMEREYLDGRAVVSDRQRRRRPRRPGDAARRAAPALGREGLRRAERAALDGEPASDRDATAESTRHRLHWALWAAKESAYKARKRREPEAVFSPREFVVELSALPARGRRSRGGRVVHRGEAFAVEVRLDGRVPSRGGDERERDGRPAAGRPTDGLVVKAVGRGGDDPTRDVRRLAAAAVGRGAAGRSRRSCTSLAGRRSSWRDGGPDRRDRFAVPPRPLRRLRLPSAAGPVGTTTLRGPGRPLSESRAAPAHLTLVIPGDLRSLR